MLKSQPTSEKDQSLSRNLLSDIMLGHARVLDRPPISSSPKGALIIF